MTTCWHNWRGNCPHWKTDRHGCKKEEGHTNGRNTRMEDTHMKHTHICPCGAVKRGSKV